MKKITVALSYRLYEEREYEVPNGLDQESPTDVEEYLRNKGIFGEDEELDVSEAWIEED